jgi:hypothetical protein
MAMFEITMTDRTTECLVEAEAYQQEGPMTTFFRSDGGRGTLDSWATRLASFRSADVLMIRRRNESMTDRPILDLVVNSG